MPNVVIRLGIDGDIDSTTLDKIKTFVKNNRSIFSYVVVTKIDQPEIKTDLSGDFIA